MQDSKKFALGEDVALEAMWTKCRLDLGKGRLKDL